MYNVHIYFVILGRCGSAGVIDLSHIIYANVKLNSCLHFGGWDVLNKYSKDHQSNGHHMGFTTS